LAAQENIELTREEVFKPVIDKAKKAIPDVAKENNFTYIFDLSEGLVVYYNENTIDILPLAKKKLGLY
jgi:outer membrane protein